MIFSLPSPFNKSELIAKNQSVDDIAKLICRGIKESKNNAKFLLKHLEKNNTRATCYAVWKFLKNNVEYKKEGSNFQSVKTISRLLVKDKFGDCKHFATCTGAILKACNIPFVIRLVGFQFGSDMPTHVYIVAYDEQKEPVYIDCVLHRFDSEPSYKFKKDIVC